MLVPFLVLGALFMYNDFVIDALNVTIKSADSIMTIKSADGFSVKNNNLTDEIALTGIIISLMMIAFAKEKDEDEFIHFTRLESWQWTVVVNFALLIAATWLFYDFAFLDVMVYNMLTIPVLFIIRFQYMVFKNKRSGIKSLAL